MSALVRRGRILFLIIAGALIVERVCNVVLIFAAEDATTGSGIRSAVRHIGIIITLACVWYGQVWMRWLLAAALASHGAVLVVVLYPLLQLTPPESAGAAAYSWALIFSIPMAYAALHVTAGLMLVFSPSITAFLKHQARPNDSTDMDRQRFLATLDGANAEAAGGTPTTIERELGTLPLPSGTLLLGDPQSFPADVMEISGFGTGALAIKARLWKYPSGHEKVVALTISSGDASALTSGRVIGHVGIDSATVVVADKAAIAEHWSETGVERIGFVNTARDDTVLRLLKKRFGLRAVRVNALRAEIVGPVSEELERQIEDYLKTIPEYAQFVFLHFHVQTNNSFERVNYRDPRVGFLPVGNQPLPLLFASDTGRGDGCYAVRCEYSGETPRVVTIDFLADNDE